MAIYIKTNIPGLVKKDNIIINTNTKQLELIKHARKIAKEQKNLVDEFNIMKQELIEIKQLLLAKKKK